MNPILTPQLAVAVGSAGVIVALMMLMLWLAARSKRPTGNGAHETITGEERQLNAVRARAHNHWQEHAGAQPGWSPKDEMPAEQPLDAHITRAEWIQEKRQAYAAAYAELWQLLTIWERERFVEEEVAAADGRRRQYYEAIARQEMERDAAELWRIQTDFQKQVRWKGYDPKEATQEISWSPEMAGKR